MKKAILLFVLSLLTLVAVCPEGGNEQKSEMIYFAEKALFYQEVFSKPFSKGLFWQALIYENIQSPLIVFKQAQLETGNFTSDIFLNANNVFGMKVPYVRETYACGVYKGHAMYRSWLSSVKDFAEWQRYYASKGYDITNYLVFLHEIGYATDKNYLSKIIGLS